MNRLERLLCVLSLVLLLGAASVAQKAPLPSAKQDPNSITGGLGLTWINGEAYYLIRVAPELAFGNFGFGLDLQLHISSTDHKLRKEDFNQAYDYARIIRYLRWGHKGDAVYARVGELDYAQLGQGFIMYLYNNSPSYDDRRLGTEFDLNFNKYGLETVYGDIARPGVFGLRGYARPLQFTTLAATPILGAMEVGATWAGDMRQDSKDTTFRLVGTVPTPMNSGTMNEVGADIAFPLLRVATVSSTLYGDYAKIVSFGSGEAVGLQTNFTGLGLVNLFTKFERRWDGDKFLPNYFDAFYELERYELAGTAFSSKAELLNSLKSSGPGYFGDLTLAILGKLQIRGTFSKLDKNDTSGVLHFSTSTGSLIPVVMLDAGYDKKYIRNGKDLFTLDERSLLYASIGYKPYPFMIVSTLYLWTFVPVTDANGNTHYATQKRIQPQISLVFPL